MQLHQSGFNKENLINIKNTNNKTGNFTISTCNTKSLKFKELQVSDFISDYGLDALLVTETLLNKKKDNN